MSSEVSKIVLFWFIKKAWIVYCTMEIQEKLEARNKLLQGVFSIYIDFIVHFVLVITIRLITLQFNEYSIRHRLNNI